VYRSTLGSREIKKEEEKKGWLKFEEDLVFKAHRLLYHSTLGSRVIKKKVKSTCGKTPHPVRLFFFFTLVTGPRRSLSLKLSDTRVYEHQIRARLGTPYTLDPNPLNPKS